MKKTLVFLLLVCVTLFTLTGCGKGVSTKKLATEDEIEEFFEDKYDALYEMTEEKYSFSFEYSSSSKFEEGADSGSAKIKYEGRVIIDKEKPEKSALYVKGSQTSKGVEYGSEGKTKYSGKAKVEYIIFDEVSYEAIEVTEKNGESKYVESHKEKIDVEEEAALYAIMSRLQTCQIGNFESFFEGEQYYIDGDKCLVVTSTASRHVEVTLKFEKDELVSISVLQKSYNSKTEIEIKFGDVKSISKPKNASKYKDMED